MNGSYVKEGTAIIDLLDSGLDTGEFAESSRLRELFAIAKEALLGSNPQVTIKSCMDGLDILNKPTFQDQSDLNRPRYSKGLFLLLLGAAYLDDKGDNGYHSKAEANFQSSIEEFASRKWLHLESLAFLALAKTFRIARDFDEAEAAIDSANGRLRQEGMPDKVPQSAVSDLQEEIGAERERINEDYDATTSERGRHHDEPTIKRVPIFKISSMNSQIVIGNVNKVNILSQRDYARSPINKVETVAIDLKKYPQYLPDPKVTDFILQIDKQAANPTLGLNCGDWLFVQTSHSVNELHSRTVVILSDEGPPHSAIRTIKASLRTFIYAEDHYVLRSINNTEPQIILINHKTSISRKDELESIYHQSVRRIDEVQICGVVVRDMVVSQESITRIAKTFIWHVPVVNSFVWAGVGEPISEPYIEGYREIKASFHRDGGYFIIAIADDGRKGDAINNGVEVLIKQQAQATNGKIHAVTIMRPNAEPLPVLGRYFVVEDEGGQYWRLEPITPGVPHLIVIPPPTDLRSAQGNDLSKGIVRIEDAEVRIVGRFIKVVEQN